MKVPFRFRPKLAPTLATLALLPLLVKLGLWQWHKGQEKLELQQRIERLAKAPPVSLGSHLLSGEGLRYRRVVAKGRFEPGYQVLLDNQVQGEQAGFHVLTPLRIEGSDVRVLVNRGWVPLGRSRDDLPAAVPPAGLVEVSGTLWAPARPKVGQTHVGRGWHPLWENLDLAGYREQVPFPMQSFVIRLAPTAPGCYVCDWPRPDERAGVNLGYALQWFGMAVVLMGFYGYASLERQGGKGDE